MRREGIFRPRRAHRTDLDQGADRKSRRGRPLAGGGARYVARQSLRAAAQNHRRGAVVQGPGRGRPRRSVDRTARGPGRCAEAHRRRSAHRFGAGFRDAVRRLAGGQAPRAGLTASCSAGDASSGATICTSASTANSCSRGTSASWSSRPTTPRRAACAARAQRQLQGHRIRRQPVFAGGARRLGLGYPLSRGTAICGPTR